MTHSTRRFWTMAGLASGSLLLLLMSLVWKEWIEIVFHVDPDRVSGGTEWLIVALASAATVIFALRARIEWRREQSATA